MTTAVVRDQLEPSLFADLFDEPLESPPPAVAEPAEVDTRAHVWIVAAEIKVEDRMAKAADFRGSFTAPVGTRVDALEVYCRGCRRPYEDVSTKDYEALIDNQHLIGGDQSVRAERKLPEPPRAPCSSPAAPSSDAAAVADSSSGSSFGMAARDHS